MALTTVRGLTGRPVVQQGTERFLGRVKDVLLDSTGTRLLALQLTGGGWFNTARGIAWERVVAFRLDRLLVDGEPVQLSSIARGGQPLSDLVGPPQHVAAGAFIDDAVFDPNSGRILGYQLSRGVLQDLLEGRRFISIEQLLSDEDGGGATAPTGDEPAADSPLETGGSDAWTGV